MPLTAGATFAGYTIVRLLGAGAMGEVYLAEHPRLPRQDAIKILPPEISSDTEFRERFNREADLAATLYHSHIVGVHDRGEHNGRLWIAMDYVEGLDAGQLLRDKYPSGMPPQDALDIVAAVAEALDYAHQKGLVHRDVKPANVLVTRLNERHRRILLADFGIARRLDDISGLTQTNMAIGTVSYAAPEQLMGLDLDGRADQYALAAMAFHLLTGSPPFQHTNPAVVIGQHLNADPPAFASIQPGLGRLDPVFKIALSKDPNDRFPQCEDFALALSSQFTLTDDGVGPTDRTQFARAVPSNATPAQHAQSTTPQSSGAASAANRHTRRRLTAAAIVGVFLLLLVITLAWRPWQQQDSRVAGISSSNPRASSSTHSPSSLQPAAAELPKPGEEEPQTLEAATAAAQEFADRFSAADFEGAWDLMSAQVHDGISRNDYAHYNASCKTTGIPISMTGVRLQDPDTAIIRQDVLGSKDTRVMKYEGGRWLMTPTPKMAADLGRPLSEITNC